MSCATLKTRSSVFADCMTFPFSRVVRRRWCGSGTSSRVTSAGPIGQNVGNILPRRLCSHAWIGPITPVEEKIGATPVARRDIVDDGVARDVIERCGGGYAVAGLADHHAELAFPVDH